MMQPDLPSCSATVSSHAAIGHPAAGLSLIEVMVTLSIIAIATSLVVLTAKPARPDQAELARMQQMVDTLSGRAAISGQPAGIVIDATTYTPALWRDGDWHAIAAQRRALPPGLSLDIPQSRARQRDAKPDWPAIVFDPLGHTEPVDLVLRSRGSTIQMRVGPDGIESTETVR